MTNDEIMEHQEADPRSNSWGIRTADPHPSGIGHFFWYESEAALRDSILRGLHAIDVDPEEWAAHRPVVGNTLNAISLIEPATASDLDDATRKYFHVEWWGQFEDLCSGSSEIALQVREDYFESEDRVFEDEHGARPVPPEEVDAFVEHVKVWNI